MTAAIGGSGTGQTTVLSPLLPSVPSVIVSADLPKVDKITGQLSRFFILAVSNNDVASVSDFLKRHVVSEDLLTQALKHVVNKGNFKFVESILTVVSIADEKLIKMAKTPTKKGDLKTAVALLKPVKISDDSRDDALIWAAYHGSIEMMEHVLATGKISDSKRGEALIWAARHESIEMMRLILASDPISNETRDEVLCWIAENKTLEMIDLLFEVDNKYWHLKDPVEKTVRFGSIALLKILFLRDDISKDSQKKALNTAVSLKSYEKVDFILKNAEFSRDDLEFIFMAAVVSGSLEITKRLLESCHVSKFYLEGGLKLSVDRNFSEIEAFLREIKEDW